MVKSEGIVSLCSRERKFSFSPTDEGTLLYHPLFSLSFAVVDQEELL